MEDIPVEDCRQTECGDASVHLCHRKPENQKLPSSDNLKLVIIFRVKQKEVTLTIAPDSLLILDMLEPDLPINPPTIVSEIIISIVTYSAARLVVLKMM